MANETAPVWKRATDTERTRAIIVERLKLTADLGREAKDSFSARMYCNGIANTLSEVGEALKAEAKFKWCRAVLKRLAQEPMLFVLRDEIKVISSKAECWLAAPDEDLEPTQSYVQDETCDAYCELSALLMGFYVPRLEAVMAAENIADSPWNGA